MHWHERIETVENGMIGADYIEMTQDTGVVIVRVN